MSGFDGTFAAFRVRHYRILWFGTICATLAFFMSTVVQNVVAFDLAGSNTAVGAVGFAQGIAMVALGPIGGALADRWPKRMVIGVSQSLPACVFAGLSIVYALGLIRIEHIAGGSFLIGVTFAFLGPARQALVVDLVPVRTRGNAVALGQVAMTAAQVLGPGIAGLLLLWDLSGAAGAYALMGTLYVVSTALLLLLPRSRMRADARETRVLGDVAEGLSYVARHPRLRALVGLYVAVIMLGFPYVTVLPAFVERELGRSAETYAFLSLVAAVGALASSLVAARYADHPRAIVLFGSMGVVFGLALIGLAAAPSYELAAATMSIAGFGLGGFMTLNSAAIVRSSDPAFFGRVISLTMLAFGAFGLMSLPVGLLADALGERATLAAMGTVVCASVAGFSLLLATSGDASGATANLDSQVPAEADR